MLNLWRRHLKNCRYRAKGRAHTKCPCPIWVDGEIDGRRVRESLDTRDWARAIRRLARMEDPEAYGRACSQPGCDELVEAGRCARHTRLISAAIASFHDATCDVAHGTAAYYRRTLRLLGDFLAKHGIQTVDAVDAEALIAYRGSRAISARTWTKELQLLRQFFRYCVASEWTFQNPAARVPIPRNLQPADREPYRSDEIIRIIAACDGIGRGPYERLRARAMVLLLRYTALRISDVATLERDRVRDGEILVRTLKNGKPVRLPVHPDLAAALELLPIPRGATNGATCRYFFWSGNGSGRAMVRDATRTLGAVFKASGVPNACSHRFRHTLATEILELGGSIEDAADILGDTPAIVRKHYAKWTRARQARITDFLARIWHTEKSASELIEKKG